MRSPPRNNPHTIPQPEGTQPLRFFFCPVFRAIPLPLFPAALPGAPRPPALPIRRIILSLHPSPLRFYFRTHLHPVPRLPHSSPSHPSDAHCPPVLLIWACASAAGLSALPIRLFFPGIPSHSHHPYCPHPAPANPRTRKKTADVSDIRCFSVVIQIRIRRAASRIQSGRT